MIAKRYQDLVCWQVATELKDKVLAFTARPSVAKDVRFCTSIQDAINSVTRNMAEGFERYNPGDFHRFLTYSKASLAEAKDDLRSALKQRYVEVAEFREMWALAVRTGQVTAGLLRYLRTQFPQRQRK